MSCYSCNDRFTTGILKNCKYCLENVCDHCFKEFHHCDECGSLCKGQDHYCDFCDYIGEKHKKILVSTPNNTRSCNDNLTDNYDDNWRCVLNIQKNCIPRILSACCKCVKENQIVISCLQNKVEHAKKFEHVTCNICKSSDICLEDIIIHHKNTTQSMVNSSEDNSILETYSLSCMGCMRSHGKAAFLIFEQVNLCHLHRLNCDFCCQCLEDIKFNIPSLIIPDLKDLVINYICLVKS